MTKPIESPIYKNKPIKSIAALAKALRIDEKFLLKLAAEADNKYRKAKPISKPDGTFRQPWDALDVLKGCQRRIKECIFYNVEYPYYLTGSLKGKDYKANAEIHKNCEIVISEDISKFFPSTTENNVFDVWRNLFDFSDDVALILTKLTTKSGFLPEGAITSSYLANLIFWYLEPKLVADFSEREINYSRYVDDIVISSKKRLSPEEVTLSIAMIYGMLGKKGYSPKRKKHDIGRKGQRMTVTKLVVNQKPNIARESYRKLRQDLFILKKKINEKMVTENIESELNKLQGRVYTFNRFNPNKAAPMIQQLKYIRAVITKGI